MSFFEIDGSEKSGSGTILRYAATLSSITKKSLHIFNIRQKREKKGLRPQHLKVLEALKEITKGSLKNAYVGSEEIFYTPGDKIHPKNYSFDIGTAGSTTMLASAIIPVLLFAQKSSTIELTGGLFQDFAPGAHHLQKIVFPLLNRMNIDISLDIVKPGYVPTGGGKIKLKINPIKKNIVPICLEKQGNIKKIKGIALCSNLKDKLVSKRMATSFQKELEKMNVNIKSDIELLYDEKANQKGASLTCYIETDSFCIIGMDIAGKIGRTSESIGKMVAQRLIEDFNSRATVDRYTADQLILYAALADGTSKYFIPKMTDHIQSNLWLVNKILNANYKLHENLLEIRGIGFKII